MSLQSLPWSAWILSSMALQAAVVGGIVVDNYTGRPLARAVVTLRSVEGYATVDLAARADRTGVFGFPPVGAGAYLLTASRPGFATLKYGQKAWNAPGAPIFLEQEGSTFLQLRLQRLGAITGTVWDENEIGFPEQDVVIYRAARPPRLVSKMKTDDRGMYRFGGLAPGRYLIRTGAKQIDDETGLLPTFHKEVAAVEDAVPIHVSLEEQATEINVRPFFGKLVHLTGVACCPPPQFLTLVSDMGEVGGGADASGRFSFENLAPGAYELIASLANARYYSYGAYLSLTIERDTEIRVGMQQVPFLDISFEEQNGGKIDSKDIGIFARRITLAGTGPGQRFNPRAEIMPGRWEMAVSRPSSLFPVSIVVDGHEIAPGGRADGWHEFLAAPGGRSVQVHVKLSARPATVHGTVTGPGNDPVLGAPVYLEPIDPDTHKRTGDLLNTRTNARGEYRFLGLPPGSYRLLSTFDFEDPDEDTMEAARTRIAVVKEASTAAQDLDLYIR